MFFKKINIGIIGIGYVGLPLTINFSKYYKVLAFDINKKKILNLKNRKDINLEENLKKLQWFDNITFSSNYLELKKCNFYIIAVPTPVNNFNKPDLKMLINATKLVAKVLKPNDFVVYESTVFPTCTDDYCIPLMEKISKMKVNKDFYCGYSPERINPGDKHNNFKNISKIVSGSNKYALNYIYKVYKKVLKKKVYKVSSIKVAEGSKIIENIQRDLNIALINELLMFFDRLNINYKEVLKAANTKWNFLDFKPGLVGGHCIGVDPYYLSYKAKKIGFNPKILLSGRKINDGMSKYFAQKIVNFLKKKNNIKRKKILVCGVSYKENVNDIRNSKSFDFIEYLKKQKYEVICYDNHLSEKNDQLNKDILVNKNELNKHYYSFDVIAFLVAHNSFKFFKKNYKKLLKRNSKTLVFDLKNLLKTNNMYIFNNG